VIWPTQELNEVLNSKEQI